MKIYPVFIPHAGCPHRCVFCAQDRSSGRSAVPGPAEIDRYLERVLPSQGDGEIAYYGGTFAQLPWAEQEFLLTLAGRFVAAGRVAGIRVSTRPDGLDAPCLARLKRAGVTTVELGCQSFSPAVLEASGRGHTAGEGMAAIRCCREAGLTVGVQLMPGLPGAPLGEALQSLRQAVALQPSFVRIYPTLVIEGTALAALWRSGEYTPWTLEQAVEVCADMLQICGRAGLPVIRLGLQPDPHLEASLLAGPYHPAFGQLVRSRLWRRALLQLGQPGAAITVNPRDLSDLLGQRGENRAWLTRRGRMPCLTTDQAVDRGRLRLAGRDFSFDELSAQGGHHG